MISQVLKSAYMKSEGEYQNPVFSMIQPTMIQPMKVALYFDDIKGFGEWSIILSTRAQKDLRKFKHADGAVFRIVMETIR